MASLAQGFCYLENGYGHGMHPTYLLAIHADGIVVGFSWILYLSAAEASEDGYCNKGIGIHLINRFMIGEEHQGKGYGKQAVSKIIEHLKEFSIKDAKDIYDVSCEGCQ